MTLDFKPAEVNDVLRSLRVSDVHGGVVTNVTYETTKQLITRGYLYNGSNMNGIKLHILFIFNSQSKLTTARRAPLFIPANNSMATIFNYMQGKSVFLFSHN